MTGAQRLNGEGEKRAHGGSSERSTLHKSGIVSILFPDFVVPRASVQLVTRRLHFFCFDTVKKVPGYFANPEKNATFAASPRRAPHLRATVGGDAYW